MAREIQEEGTYVYLWLIHVDVWQKTTKFCKAIILQLKNKRILEWVVIYFSTQSFLIFFFFPAQHV